MYKQCHKNDVRQPDYRKPQQAKSPADDLPSVMPQSGGHTAMGTPPPE